MQVEEIQVQGQQHNEDGIFPLALSPKTLSTHTEQDTIEWVKQNKSQLSEQLIKHGAILFRGFNIVGAQQFYEFLCAFGWKFGSYAGGGGPRKTVYGPIETSTETPPQFLIPFHHELAYITTSPGKVSFYCEIPTEKDGETPILLSNRVYKRMVATNKEFIDKINTKKIRYIRLLQDKSQCTNDYQRSWQDIFGTADRTEAEHVAKRTGTDTIEWLSDGGCKVVSLPMEGIKIEPRTQKPTWFNAIVLLHPASRQDVNNSPWDVVYGDFSPIANSDVLHAAKILREEGTQFKWEKCDILLIDNTLALHARNTFVPPRRIYATILN